MNAPNPPTSSPVLAGLWRHAVAWRVELGLAVGLASARSLAASVIGWPLADLAMLAVIAAAVFEPDANNWVRSRLVRARRRRGWDAALAAVLPAPRTPAVARVGVDRLGAWAEVRVAAGTTVADVAGRADALAAVLRVMEVRVQRDPNNAAVARLRTLRRDPLARPAGPWPLMAAARSDLWTPVPVGIDEDGQPVTVRLVEHNLLVGGEPGSGKSVAVSQLVAAAALDPTATLWLLDGKLVELAAWRNCTAAFAGVDITDAIAVLRQVKTAMDDRYQQLLDAGKRKLAAGESLHVVIIDELAHYVTWPERKLRDAFTDTLRDLVSRGRAAGVIVIAATQKPSADVVPTSLRDLFGYRWAFRCTTPTASDTILGGGWASQGVNAASIPTDQRGVGWLLHEAGQPVRLRAHHLDDTAITNLAGRATQLRTQHDHE